MIHIFLFIHENMRGILSCSDRLIEIEAYMPIEQLVSGSVLFSFHKFLLTITVVPPAPYGVSRYSSTLECDHPFFAWRVLGFQYNPIICRPDNVAIHFEQKYIDHISRNVTYFHFFIFCILSCFSTCDNFA